MKSKESEYIRHYFSNYNFIHLPKNSKEHLKGHILASVLKVSHPYHFFLKVSSPHFQLARH